MVTFATPGSDESVSFTFLVHEKAQCMSGTLKETSVSLAAASVLALSSLDSDGRSGIEISTSGDVSLTGAGAGDWEHPHASNTDRLARNRNFIATYPFNIRKQNTTTKNIGVEAAGGKRFCRLPLTTFSFFIAWAGRDVTVSFT